MFIGPTFMIIFGVQAFCEMYYPPPLPPILNITAYVHVRKVQLFEDFFLAILLSIYPFIYARRLKCIVETPIFRSGPFFLSSR